MESEQSESQKAGEYPSESEQRVNQPVLETTRLVLRAVCEEDLPTLAALANDKEVYANTRTMPYPYTIQDATEFHEKAQTGWIQGKFANFAIIDKDRRQFMGTIGLMICQENHQAELGYWIGREYRSQGFVTEAAKRILEFGFEDLGLYRIHAHYLTRNPASGRILQKIGMLEEGLLRGHARKLGKFEDVRVFGILISDYQKRSG